MAGDVGGVPGEEEHECGAECAVQFLGSVIAVVRWVERVRGEAAESFEKIGCRKFSTAIRMRGNEKERG